MFVYLCVFSIIFEIVYYANDPKHFIPVFIIFVFQMNIKIKFINTQCKIIGYDLTHSYMQLITSYMDKNGY